MILSIILAATYSATMTLFSTVLGMTVESGIFLFYFFILILFLLPRIPGQETKSSLFRLIKVVLFPSNTISFPEVLLAGVFYFRPIIFILFI